MPTLPGAVLMLRKCWIDMRMFAGFTLQDKQFCYRKSKSGVCPDDGNFCLSSPHWSLIGPLTSRVIWPTNKNLERIVLLIISENGKQLVLFSLSCVPGQLHWLQYCQLFQPPLTDREGNLIKFLAPVRLQSRGQPNQSLQQPGIALTDLAHLKNCPISFANLFLFIFGAQI